MDWYHTQLCHAPTSIGYDALRVDLFSQVAATTWRKPKLAFRKSWVLCECTHIHNDSNIMKIIAYRVEEIPNVRHMIKSSNIAQGVTDILSVH